MSSEADNEAVIERILGRLERIGMTPQAAATAAGLPVARIEKLLLGQERLPRGKQLQRLADALGASVSYLIGLEPDTPVPDEYLSEDQGSLGLLAADEEALLRAYRRLDVPARAALMLLLHKIAPEPVVLENKPRLVNRPATGASGR